MSTATCRKCDVEVTGSYARARICKDCQKPEVPAWLTRALSKYVVEAWKSEGVHVVLVTPHDDETGRQCRGENKSFKKALEWAISNWSEE